jgi:hypothetical protein
MVANAAELLAGILPDGGKNEIITPDAALVDLVEVKNAHHK